MSFDRARTVADAVLFEGYALYPYRPSSKKNASRWQFGVVAPRAFSEVDGGDPWWFEAQCLVSGVEPDARLAGKLRFLRTRSRRIFAPEAIESIEVEGRLLVSWDEAEVQEVEFGGPVDGASTPFELPADVDVETVGGGYVRIERRRSSITADISVAFEPVASEPPLTRLIVRVENTTPWQPGGSRDEAMTASLLGAHLLLEVTGASFVSLIDPPEFAKEAAAKCKNVRVFPVLAGEPGTADVVLASPIILYDHPQIAPESPGDLFDATEIDEILTLRTRALTDVEKREACAADPRVAALIERADTIPRAALERLHGALRQRRPDGELAASGRGLAAGERAHAPGDRVRLRPGSRRTDAQDMFLEGMMATVRSVMQDIDGRTCLAVTVDGDPAEELHLQRGRFHYFHPDEVEDPDEAAATITST
jgi:hypothetical protein